MNIKILTLIGILFLFSSCDCLIEVNGKVISSNTGKPISEVIIEIVDKNLVTKTDQNGNFSIGEMTGFCYSLTVRASYDNYKSFEIELDFDYRNYKVKRELKSAELDKPFYPDSTDRSTNILSTWIEKYSGNFKIKSDSLIIYLDENDLEKEIELIKWQLKKTNGS